MNNLLDTLKEKVATTVSDTLTKQSAGFPDCIIFGVGEPEMPLELILDGIEED